MATAKKRAKAEPKPAGRVITFDYVPHVIQAIAHAAPERYILFGGAVGGGKSVCGCGEGIQSALDFPGNRILISRFDHTAFMLTTYVTMMGMLPPALIAYHHHSVPSEIGLINGSAILYGGLKTTKQDDPFTRLKSMELGFAFVDEATDLPEEYYKWLMTRMRWNPPGIKIPERRKKIFLTSNPEHCWLYEAFIKPQMEGKPLPDHLFIPSKPSDNPYLDPGYIPGMRSQFSLDWQERYLEGKWVFGDDDLSAIPYGLVKKGMEGERIFGLPVQVGIDVADKGGDETVVVIRRGTYAYVAKTFRYVDTAHARLEIEPVLIDAEAMNNGAKPRVAIDVIGLGVGLYNELRLRGYNVAEARNNEKAQDDTRFANSITEWWWRIRTDLETGQLTIQEDTELSSQLTNRHWDTNQDALKRIKVESKPDMRKRGLSSPDRAEALAMTYYGCCSRHLANLRVPGEAAVVQKPSSEEADLTAYFDGKPLTRHAQSEYDEVVSKRLRNPRIWQRYRR